MNPRHLLSCFCGILPLLSLSGCAPLDPVKEEATPPIRSTFENSSAVNLVFWPGAILSASDPGIESLTDRCANKPWQSGPLRNTPWLQLELPEAQTALDRVRIVFHARPHQKRPSNVRIYVGEDAGDQRLSSSPVAVIQRNQSALVEAQFAPVSGRVVRVELSDDHERPGTCLVSGFSVFSQDEKQLHPDYPISEQRSGGTQADAFSGWWDTNRFGPQNLLSANRLSIQLDELMEDKAVRVRTQYEDTVLRLHFPQHYNLHRVRVGHSPEEGRFAPPKELRISLSSDGRDYFTVAEASVLPDTFVTEFTPATDETWHPIRYLKLTIPKDLDVQAFNNLSRIEVFGTPVSGAQAFRPDRPVDGGDTVARLDVPSGSRVSAVVLDQDHRVVRTLFAQAPLPPGAFPLRWDGLDDHGRETPDGTYTWKALYSTVTPEALPPVGNTARPMTKQSSVSPWVTALAADEAGRLYQAGSFDESGKAVRRYLADGAPDWSINLSGAYGIAVDQDYVYVLMTDIAKKERKQWLRRLHRETGVQAPFEGKPGWWGDAEVNPAEAPPEASDRLSAADIAKQWNPDGSHLGVDDEHIWFVNKRQQRIDLMDKRTGDRVGGFPLSNPAGIAVTDAGLAWVSHARQTVALFNKEGGVQQQWNGFDQPGPLALDAIGQTLLVAEKEKRRIIAVDTTTGEPLWTRGQRHTPGPVAMDTWRDIAALAIDAAGNYWLSDTGNQRVLGFRPDGSVREVRKADFCQPGPQVSPEIDPSLLLSRGFQYHVNLDNGQWDFTHNWAPKDDAYFLGPTFLRRLPNGRIYLFCLSIHSWGPVIYAISEDGQSMRRSSMLARFWTGPQGNLPIPWKDPTPFSWQDSNADGQIQDEERRESDMGAMGLIYAHHGWVDEDGALWFIVRHLPGASVMRLAPRGFDEHQNPIYEWADAKTMVAADALKHLDFPSLVRPAPGAEGDIYVVGETAAEREHSRKHGMYHQGGFHVARFGRDGQFLGSFHVPIEMVSFAVDDRFVYAAQNPSPQCVSVYTPDGLLVTRLVPGEAYGWSHGWMDTSTPLSAFRYQDTHTHHVYTEEIYLQQITHWRFQGGPEHIQTESGPIQP